MQIYVRVKNYKMPFTFTSSECYFNKGKHTKQKKISKGLTFIKNKVECVH